MKKLHYNTVSKTLIKCLKELMKEPLLENFILVGGTSLSLQLGHRISIDIDLFTDSPYGSVDFKALHKPNASAGEFYITTSINLRFANFAGIPLP